MTLNVQLHHSLLPHCPTWIWTWIVLTLSVVTIVLMNPVPVSAFTTTTLPRQVPCGHSVVSKTHHEVFHHVHVGEKHEILKRSVDQALRIHLYFDDSVKRLPQSHRRIVESHVKTAAKFWESTLRVRATEQPIRLRPKCVTPAVKYQYRQAFCVNGCMKTTVCGDITIPTEHLEGCKHYDLVSGTYTSEPNRSPGVRDSDFILYIATIPSDKCLKGQTIAYAAYCQQEHALDRPVAGYFSICPNSISTSRQQQQQLLSTMKHEILHALGFTAGLFAFYRDEKGRPLTPRNLRSGLPLHFNAALGMFVWSERVVKRIVYPSWLLMSGVTEKVVDVMVTPKVKEEVRRHFDCPTLAGAELEDQGINGTRLTHWEKRVFENEAMTGTYTQNSVISNITLAMMEDTGWYKSNFSKAEPYLWGRGLGCEFVHNSCFSWIKTRMAKGESIHPFCDQVKKGELWTDCAHNRQSVALCNLIEYPRRLPTEYQYFHHLRDVSANRVEFYGGSVELADYCPYLQEFSWTDRNNKPVRGSSCLDAHNNIRESSNYFGEAYSPSSLCFNHHSVWSLYRCHTRQSPQHAGSGCYQYSCHDNVGLVLHVHGTSNPCRAGGQVLHILFNSSHYLHSGTIQCPPCQEVCPQTSCPPEVKLPVKKNPSYVAIDDNAFCQGTSLPSAFTTLLVCCVLGLAVVLRPFASVIQ